MIKAPRLPRRTWLQLISSIVLTGGAGAQTGSQTLSQGAGGITRDVLRSALLTAGLQFTDPQLDTMLPGAKRYLAQYMRLRSVEVPPETSPAFSFSPVLPGYPAPKGASRFRQTALPAIRHLPKPDEIAFLSALELSALIRRRKITSLELTKLYLDRLKTYGPKLNCVITLTEDLAVDQAKKADAETRAGKRRSPLHGIPYGAKDLFDTAGILTTWGAEPYQKRIPTTDATVIERLRNKGAVLVAKLSMGALAQGGLWFGGMTKTPWDYEQTSSGSSAGSASATAAGLVGFSLGTETLGSIVSPSTRCGVAGLRPTFGRVSRSGAMALSWTMDKIGPICRSVADCAEVLRAIAGPDGKDLSVIPAPLHWNATSPIRRMKVGYLAREFAGKSNEQQPVFHEALDVLRKAGVDLQPIEMPDFPYEDTRFLLTAEAAAAFDDITRDGRVDQLKGQDPSDWPNSFRTARLIPAVEYIRAQRVRTMFMHRMQAFMQSWDVFISPTSSASLTATNLTGQPQVVVPCGFAQGLPQGLLFTGRLFEEGAPMRLAYEYERRTTWHTMRPALLT